ncbi:MAG: choice-of-anchor D domain-containing protein [Gemmataceae bacterium]|nr:choice-of-anchor D domain-containing protein [Gemmataceae bacterium]
MLAPLPATQEIEVIFNGNNLNSGGPAAFGSTSVGVPVTRTFTIRNVGSANLSLGALGLVPSGFSVAGYAPTVLAPGATTSFSVTLTAAAPGTYTGALTISNNDGDENPFVINLSGTVTNFKQIIDDGDTPFTIVGAWIPTTGQGYQNDVRYIAAGTGTATATWTFIGLASGTYRVSATWSPFSNRATNAPFTVNTGVSTLVTVNQQLTPSSFTEAGTAWQDLAGPYVVTGGSIIVTLSNAANNFVIADAIRIEKII